MAGMFYSLQEAAEKLNKTEKEIKQIVQEGNLREFRDGPNLLFKVEEVEALMSQASEEALEAVELEPEDMEAEELEPEALELEVSGLEELEPEIPEAEEFELEIPADENPELEALEAEMLAPAEEAAGTSEILLAPETGAPVAPSELTNADTALTGEGISVLGETDGDYEITDDTLAETAIPMGTAGTGPEMPLEEIEGDVNLDSFGSGSGLLDLSLQADDTSLGGILDEIYTDEVEGAEPAFEEGVGDSAAAVAAEAGEIPEEETAMVPQSAPDVSMAISRPFMEAAPDMSSNTLGMLLFLPLLVIIYTAVVAVSGQRAVMPSILSSIQAFIWFIMGGAAVVALLVAGVAFMAGGGGATKVKKEKKPKVPKAPKAKKEKPPKKPKAPKPKKEKKKK